MTITFRSMRSGSALRALGVAAALSAPALADGPRFTITELPTLGGAESVGVAVNNAGLISGESNRPNQGYHVATAWLPPDYHPVYLTGSGGSVATAGALNDSGLIVGVSDILDHGAYRAAPPALPAATIAEMGTHGGIASGVSGRGDICGSWFNGNGSQPFVIQRGAFSPLPLLEGGTQADAFAINANGLVIGWSEWGPNGGFNRAAMWQDGVVTELLSGNGLNAALAVNDEGWIVGYASGQVQYEAALWTSPQTRINLGALSPWHWENVAHAINNRRQIVGTSSQRAFLWENGVMQDLETMIPPNSGWLLYAANGISDNGLIVGEGLHNGVIRGFLLRARCEADFDGDGSVGPADVAGFVSLWFSGLQRGTLAGDFDGDGVVGPADIGAFINAWFAALTNGC